MTDLAENTHTEKLVQVTSLSRYYGERCAVNNISFELQKGEILGFLGPNGAGKSTTMQMLCGTLAPSQGSIKINGIDLLEEPKAAKAHIGFLPEQPPVYKELTVDEYLTYCIGLHGIKAPQRQTMIDQAKERCGLSDVGKRLIANLSKGYQQRVGIAQAIAHLPALVILDEPTVGLDPLQIRQIRTLIKELSATHGVVLSTHILPEVQATCNRVQIINEGKLVFADSVSNLSTHLQCNSFITTLTTPPATTELNNISGIKQIETLENNRLRIHFESDDTSTNLIETFVKHSVEKNWGLTELTPETHSLEQIFVDLTTTDIEASAE